MSTDTNIPTNAYMFSEGVVEEVGSRKVVIKVGLQGQCSATCGSCGLCGPTPQATRIRLPRHKAPELQVGRRVRVGRHVLNPALAAGAVFGIPLLCVLAALAAWYGMAPTRIDSPLTALLGFAGLVAGAGIVCVADWIYARKYPPTVDSAPPATEPAG